MTSYVTLDGISLRHGSSAEVPGYNTIHRSSTLPRFRPKSGSLPEIDSSVYYHPKSRSSSISSSSTSSGSQAFLRSFKTAPPVLSRQQSVEGDVDIADCIQLVGNQCVPSQIQHHQLHHSSVSSPSSSGEVSEGLGTGTGQGKPRPLKSSVSVPLLLVRKDSYSEAIHSGEEGGSVEKVESIGGITFSTSIDSNSTSMSKAQSPTETKQSLKPSGYRATSNNGLEAIREEKASQISLTSSGSSDVSSQGGQSRAGSSSPDKPKVKGRSHSPKAAAVKSRSHRAISSDV